MVKLIRALEVIRPTLHNHHLRRAADDQRGVCGQNFSNSSWREAGLNFAGAGRVWTHNSNPRRTLRGTSPIFLYSFFVREVSPGGRKLFIFGHV